jgi:hypothetical protein
MLGLVIEAEQNQAVRFLKSPPLTFPGWLGVAREFSHARTGQFPQTPRAVKVTEHEQNDRGGPTEDEVERSKKVELRPSQQGELKRKA